MVSQLTNEIAAELKCLCKDHRISHEFKYEFRDKITKTSCI
jgi:hypothetical protein